MMWHSLPMIVSSSPLHRWLGYVAAALTAATVASGIGYLPLSTALTQAAAVSFGLLLIWVVGTGVTPRPRQRVDRASYAPCGRAPLKNGPGLEYLAEAELPDRAARLQLRPFSDVDYEAVLDLHSRPEVARYLT
jgi:hypothetical protein